MKKLGPTLQLVSNLAVLAGLALVGLELNQSSRLARAQLEAQANDGWIAIDASKQGDAFATALAKAIEAPETLTLAEMVELDGYLFTYVDQLVRHATQYELGFADVSLDEVVNASISDFFGNRYAQAWWAETKERWAPQLIAAVDAYVPGVSVQQDSIYYARIRDRLRSEGR